MSDITFEQMLEDSLKTIHNGDIVDGVVISVKPDEAVFNIGYKADAILTKDEYSNEEIEDLSSKLHIGDSLPLKIVKVNDGEGQVVVSYKRFIADKGNERLYEAYKNKEVLKGKVISRIKGGIIVSVEETEVFIPSSLVSDTFQQNRNDLIGEEIEFLITDFSPRKKKIIGNRRVLIEEEKKKIRRQLQEQIKVGDVIKGKIQNVTKFGAFVDIGGIDGLVHISELSWGKVFNPKKFVKAGEEVEVIVKELSDDKISLSMKFDEANPWNNIREHVKVGDVYDGVVTRIAPFGAFVEIVPGVEGLLHISQISKKHTKNVADILEVGQHIKVKAIDFIEQDKKISLSSKVLEMEEDTNDESNEEVSESLDNTSEDTNIETSNDSLDEASQDQGLWRTA